MSAVINIPDDVIDPPIITPLELIVPDAVILLANINPLELILSFIIVVDVPKVPRSATTFVVVE